MENNQDEYGFPMPPVSWGALEDLAGVIAEKFFPYTLEKPTPIDFQKLMKQTMLENGFRVYPVSYEEIPGKAGLTEPTMSMDEHIILLRYDLYDQIDLGVTGSQAHFAIGTLLHEFGHALLNHDYRLGKILQLPTRIALLARKKNTEIKPYENADDQAWCLAGHLAMPHRTIEMIQNPSVPVLSRIYGVSTKFVRGHIRRLGMILPETEELGEIVPF